MKKISLWATMLAMLVICGLCVTSCGKDDEEEGGDNGGGKTNYTLDDYVDKYWMECSRVGNNLIVEFVFENISDQTIYGAELALTDGCIKDNLGNIYYTDRGSTTSVYLASAISQDGIFTSALSNYGKKWQSINIPAGAKAHYVVKITKFDSSGRANNISFDAVFKVVSGLPSQSYTIETSTIPVTDNRIRANGIQTPDLNIGVQLVGAEVDEDDNLTIEYTIKNNTGIILQNFTVGVLENKNAIDDVNNSYYWRDNVYASLNNSDYAVENGYNRTYYNGNGFFGKWCKTNIPADATVPAKILIKGFDKRARSVTLDLGVSCENYEPMDNQIHFITIPVQR